MTDFVTAVKFGNINALNEIVEKDASVLNARFVTSSIVALGQYILSIMMT